MKFARMKLLLIIGLSFVSSLVVASPVTSRVTHIGFYGDGRVFVQLEETINQAGCVNNRFDLTPGHAQAEKILSIAMVAYSTGKHITIQTNGCYSGFPTMDTSANTYFYLNP